MCTVTLRSCPTNEKFWKHFSTGNENRERRDENETSEVFPNESGPLNQVGAESLIQKVSSGEVYWFAISVLEMI